MENDNENEFNDLVLKPPLTLSSLFNQFNNTPQTHDCKDLIDNVIRYKYHDLEEVQSIKIPSCFSLFQINTCYLNKNFEGLEYLIKSTNINIDIIAI